MYGHNMYRFTTLKIWKLFIKIIYLYIKKKLRLYCYYSFTTGEINHKKNIFRFLEWCGAFFRSSKALGQTRPPLATCILHTATSKSCNFWTRPTFSDYRFEFSVQKRTFWKKKKFEKKHEVAKLDSFRILCIAYVYMCMELSLSLIAEIRRFLGTLFDRRKAFPSKGFSPVSDQRAMSLTNASLQGIKTNQRRYRQPIRPSSPLSKR